MEGKARFPDSMTPKVLADVMKSQSSEYQFIDVREESELDSANIKDTPFINLPLSEIQGWAPKVKTNNIYTYQ